MYIYRCASCGSVVDGQRFCANCGAPNANFSAQQAGQPPNGQGQQPNSYGQHQGHGQPYGYEPQQQHYRQQPPYAQRENDEWKKFAISALVCGIVAMVLPIPVLDLIVGIAAIILVVKSHKLGGNGGLHITAIVLAAIGTVFALSFTLWMLFIMPIIWQGF